MAMVRIARIGISVLTIHRLFCLWIFGDVAYAVLPIIVLAVITAFLGAGFDGFLVIKEWSFATIVMFGVSIRKLIRLKVEIQQGPRSYKLDSGVQLYVLLLIGAVLVLSLVILVEKGVLPVADARILGASQFFLFVTALVSLLATVLAEDALETRTSRLPNGISKSWLLERLNWQLARAADCIDYVLYAAERSAVLRFSTPIDNVKARRDEERQVLLVLSKLERIDELVAAARRGIDSIKNAGLPVGPLDQS